MFILTVYCGTDLKSIYSVTVSINLNNHKSMTERN